MVDIWWYGQACFRVKGKSASLVFDPYDSGFTGLSPLKVESDIVCVSHDHKDHNNFEVVKSAQEGKTPFVISGPGEYEILGVNIVGIASFHDDKQGADRGENIIYSASIDDVNIVHLGDFGQKKLSQEQEEQLTSCDVLLIPVGGTYTIDGKEAPDIISQIDPKIVVPMHYKTEGLNFPLDGVEKFLSSMGKENSEAQAKISISKDRLPQELEIVVLEKQ